MRVRSLRFWALPVALLFTASLHAQGATTPTETELRMAVCTQCHGREGRATNAGYFPSLDGKPAHYLYEQLRNFRDGRRLQGHMAYLLTNVSDAYLQELADYFAQQPPHPVPPVHSGAPAEVLERGRALVLHGDAAREIPACVRCHGEALTGVQPGIPAIVGLPSIYISAQLGAWAAGKRHAAEPDCMGQVGRKLTQADVQAVTAWLAGQPVPPDSRPAARPAQELPLRCSLMGARP